MKSYEYVAPAPKVFSVGFVGIPEGSVIQSVFGEYPNYTVRHANLGTNHRWERVSDTEYAFVIDRFITDQELFWVLFPDGTSMLLLANPWSGKRASCLSATLLLDGDAIVPGVDINPINTR